MEDTMTTQTSFLPPPATAAIARAGGRAGGREASPRLGRRAVLTLLGGGALWLGLSAGPARAGAPSDLCFRIRRKGAVIGTHELRFTPAEDGFTVESQVDIAVKVAFITAFRYVQHTVDRWRDGTLVASDVRTDHNGTKTRLAARAAGEALYLEGPEGKLTLRLGTMTDLCFWNPAIVRQREIVDTRSGRLLPLRAHAGRAETVRVAGRDLPATRYGVASAQGDGDIWYDAANRWVKGQLRRDGETLEHELLA
jgi:Family of unknown function (DUF6134)